MRCSGSWQPCLAYEWPELPVNKKADISRLFYCWLLIYPSVYVGSGDFFNLFHLNTVLFTKLSWRHIGPFLKGPMKGAGLIKSH